MWENRTYGSMRGRRKRTAISRGAPAPYSTGEPPGGRVQGVALLAALSGPDLSDTDQPDADASEVGGGSPISRNFCGGRGVLDFEGEEVEPGAACGAFGEGALVCGSLDTLVCVGQADQNACGGYGDLPAELGAACGLCEDGVWACNEAGGASCLGAGEPNGCGGCASLSGRPGSRCTPGAEASTWVCTTRESLTCLSASVNACGGEGSLTWEGAPAGPGRPCDTRCGAGDGVLVCGGADTLECVPTARALPANACGGCGPLPGAVGQPCGACGGGTWRCASGGSGAMICGGASPMDACGGCSGEAGRPGEGCGEGRTWLCAGTTLVCAAPTDDALSNACGGTSRLQGAPGDACGPCRRGRLVCETQNRLACAGDTPGNVCGGCEVVAGREGDACGDCGSGRLECRSQRLRCIGDQGVAARNACGGCGPLGASPGETCGACLNWACTNKGGLLCEADASQEGCGDLLTCADLDCEEEGRLCEASDGVEDARCAGCLAGLEEVGGRCVTPTPTVRSCAQAGCAGQNRVCVQPNAQTDATCGGCQPGAEEWEGVCRIRKLLGQPCATDDECVAGAWCPSETSERRCSPRLAIGGEIFAFQWTPAGSFRMGSLGTELGRHSNEGTSTQVISSNLFFMRTPVTQGQWSALAAQEPPSSFRSCGTDCPVEQVTWWSALMFSNALSRADGLEECYNVPEASCQGTWESGFLMCPSSMVSDVFVDPCSGYRLPTEVEWEYAARAGTLTPTYSVGTDTRSRECGPNAQASELATIALHCRPPPYGPRPVAERRPNAWGLHDMLGSVHEWTTSATETRGAAAALEYHEPTNEALLVVRGGSWSDPPAWIRSAARLGVPVHHEEYDVCVPRVETPSLTLCPNGICADGTPGCDATVTLVRLTFMADGGSSASGVIGVNAVYHVNGVFPVRVQGLSSCRIAGGDVIARGEVSIVPDPVSGRAIVSLQEDPLDVMSTTSRWENSGIQPCPISTLSDGGLLRELMGALLPPAQLASTGFRLVRAAP